MTRLILNVDKNGNTSIRWDIWTYLVKNNLKYTVSINADCTNVRHTITSKINEKEFVKDLKELVKKDKGKITTEVKQDNLKNNYTCIKIVIGKNK